MGLTGVPVRGVFSKSRSVGDHDSNVKNYGMDKRRWSSFRFYLCGDEINSVLAEDDSASVNSSEATVTQPIADDLKEELEIQCEEKEDVEQQILQENQTADTKILNKDEAATIIQSAFRGFMKRRRGGRKEEMSKVENPQGIESPSRKSVCTSVEVQIGNSVETLKVREETVTTQHRVQLKTRSQVSKLKEDWDDSTVSSNISKMRIQQRLEAMTRRERALAYAFSQQLRICSKKSSTQSSTEESNVGWNWLERWMATRHTENYLIKDHMSKHHSSINGVISRCFDVAEEEESCGSNDITVGIDNPAVTAHIRDDRYRPIKNRPRQKSLLTYQYLTRPTKVTKKDCSGELKRERTNANASQK
ncbi:hypothetical protein NE237_033303 [Protea cynaroides]|uniref:Uncharacterized protein n=1 Tax=Protea cynaroides TaxID=273540 RepID=A0A9Q0L5B1_9MAGN|nr:hypothetical protein NE237_033303 [Protea cynaroides]